MAYCVYALINQLIYITKSECLILHYKAFRADYNLRSTQIGAPSAARILIVRYLNKFTFKQVSNLQDKNAERTVSKNHKQFCQIGY